MLPEIILSLLNKYFISSGIKINKAKPSVEYLKKAGGIFIMLLLFSFALYAQERTREYNVSYKGSNVGSMQLYENKTGANVYMKMVSNVQMNFFVNIKVNTEEE